MTETVGTQRKKIHPHKFTLWVAIASIIMMFAGLTSAYIVKGSMPGWVNIGLPKLFYYSTAVILLSSVTIQLAVKAFKERDRSRFRMLMAVTLLLGLAFVAMQLLGFSELYHSGIKMEGSGAGQFLYIIFGLHALHVIGGVIALLVLVFKSYSAKVRNYDPTGIEVMATYWHFVDFLWLYLFVFFMLKM